MDGSFGRCDATTMRYFQTFEMELLKLLNGNASEQEIVRWASEKVLESYRNGLTAGGKGETVKRQGKSRRRGIFPKERGEIMEE